MIRGSRGEVGKLVLGDVTSECIRTANKTERWCVQEKLELWIDVLNQLNSKVTSLDSVHKKGSELKMSKPPRFKTLS